jgi:hypothetical protein
MRLTDIQWGMNMPRAALVASIVICAISPAVAENAYHAPGIRHVSSARPIPPNHARCMKFVDEYLTWLKAGVDGAFKLPLTRAVATRTYVEIADMDWGPLSAANAAAMTAKAEAELPTQTDELAKSRASRQAAIAEIERSNDPATRQMWRQGVDLAEANITMFESKVRLLEAELAFARCAGESTK